MQLDSNLFGRHEVSFQHMIHWSTRGLHISLAFAISFILGAGLIASLSIGEAAMSALILIAACACGYLALNIGANDVANSLGSSFGSGALSFPGAIGVGIIFSAAGAYFSGDSVILTISQDIVSSAEFGSGTDFVFSMIAALTAAAVWLSIGSWLGFQVSTTHSVIGALLGAAVTATGVNAVDWDVVLEIFVGWIASPLIGGLMSAMLFSFLESVIFNQVEILAAARRWIPALTGIMVTAFIVYLFLDNQGGDSKPVLFGFYLVAAGIFVGVVSLMKSFITRISANMSNNRYVVNSLFKYPFILSAALVSFAHGANDIANAVGPLSAIIGATGSTAVSGSYAMPAWVMIIGISGICLGLALFATKLSRNAGKSLCALDQSKAFCVCLATSVTVTGASVAGLPVSSTYVAIGAILGICVYREIEYFRDARLIEKQQIKAVEFREMVLGIDSAHLHPQPQQRGHRKLVRRNLLFRIALVWIITLPATAAIAGGLYLSLRVVSGY